MHASFATARVLVCALSAGKFFLFRFNLQPVPEKMRPEVVIGIQIANPNDHYTFLFKRLM